MEIYTVVTFWIIGVLIGLLAGKFVADVHWMYNSGEPRRVLFQGRFYKVVDLENVGSWDLLDIHREHDCSGCEHYGGMTPDCMAPSLTPCPKEQTTYQG